MFVEVLRWNKERSPGTTLLKLAITFIVLFLFGTIFSDVDNYAHLFGLNFIAAKSSICIYYITIS